MSLHDASFNDSRHYDEVNSSFIVSTELMQSVVQQWLSVMNSWLNISQLPIWNPEWLRSRYTSLSKN